MSVAYMAWHINNTQPHPHAATLQVVGDYVKDAHWRSSPTLHRHACDMQMLHTGRNAWDDPHKVLNSARFVQSELPKRLARRLLDLQLLP